MGGKTEVEIEVENGSLKNLLEALFLRYGDELKDLIFSAKTKKVKPFYHMLVNGCNYLDLPEQLDTKLREGDVIALFPPVGGG